MSVNTAVRAGVRFRLVVSLLLLVTLNPGLAHAGTAEDAAAYLWSQQRADGAIAGTADIATPVQATAEALLALSSPGAEHDAALAFLGQVPPDDLPIEYLARLLTLVDTPGARAALATRQSFDGGFGAHPGHVASALDTGYALRALAVVEPSPGQNTLRAVGYLLARQANDGSWQGGVFGTVSAMLALRPYRGKVTGVADAMSAASSYLLARRDAGDWSEMSLRALAVLALAGSDLDPALIADDADALFAEQSAEGSWQGDAYVTALALRAFKAFEARRLGINPGSGTGAIAGRVIRAGTGEPVAGAKVWLATTSDVAILTDGDGRFLLRSVAATTQTVLAEAAGFAPAAVTVAVTSGQLADAPDLVLDVAADTAILTGVALDALQNTPVVGARFDLHGPTVASVTADDTGNVQFPALVPGAYTLTVSANEYRSETAGFAVAGGEIRQIRQLLLPADAYSGDEPVSLVLHAVNGMSGEPIAKAMLTISDQIAVAGADGSIRLDALVPGAYDAELSADGYATGRLSFSLPAGANSDLGDVPLFALDGTTAPTALNLAITVSSALDGSAIAGASLQVDETGTTYSTDTQGRVAINGLSTTEVRIALAADGFLPADSFVTASAFGDYAIDLSLTPAGGDPSRTTSTIIGTVSDSGTGAPVTGATVRLAGTEIETVTDDSGGYRLEPVEMLAFALESYASGYQSSALQAEVAQHGEYRLDIALQPGAAPSGIRIASLESRGEQAPGEPEGVVRVVNDNDGERELLLSAEVVDAEGEPLGGVELVDPVTGLPAVQFALGANEDRALVWTWRSGHVVPGSYELVLRASEAGSVDQARPWGNVLASRSIFVSLDARQQVVGEFHADPPVVQFGTTSPVQLAAFIVNDGNIELANQAFRLRLTDSETGTEKFSAEVTLPSLPLGGHQLLSFGEWLPAEAGDFDVVVEPADSNVTGRIEGGLYVGNKASGKLSVTPDKVLPGDRMVEAALLLQGVDVRGGSSADPLFFAVKEAVNKGADYVAPLAKAWHQRNRCLGCHIQTQSYVGLANADAFRDAPTDETSFLYNALASSQQPDGEVWISHPGFDTTQTTLAGWALSEADLDGPLYATKYRLAQALHRDASRNVNGHAWWAPDHWTGWWNSYESTTFLAVKSLVDTVVRASAPSNRQALRRLERLTTSSYGSYSRDLAAAPDGQYLYAARYSSQIDRIDLATGQVDPAPQYPGGVSPLGVLPSGDGSLYVSGINFIHKYLVDGSRIILRAGGGEYPDMVPAPDGGIYVTDRHNHRILHIQDDGSMSILTSYGRLNQPYGLQVLPDGGLLVANYGGSNLVKVGPDGAQEMFVESITQRPLRVQSYRDGFIFTSWNGSVHFVDAEGRIVRYGDMHWYTGVAAAGDDAWLVNYQNNEVHRFTEVSIDDAEIDTFLDDVNGAVDWALNRNDCVASFDLLRRATCLMLFGEALRVTDDETRIAQLEQRMMQIAEGLRGTQRADGGWGRTPSHGSDAIATALIGMTLEYTHPSANDPMVRNTILYLLATQRSDGAWTSSNRIIGGPPLGATSLVMAYMPKSLLRLGGIDVDVHMAFADDVEPGDASIDPVDIVDEDGLHYRWSLTGVTSNGREIRFPAAMRAMRLGESRPLATSAWLEFHNSFNDDIVRVDLDVPGVKVVSGMAIDVATDRGEYGEQASVIISGNVDNLTSLAQSGTVELNVRAAGAATPLASFGVIPLGTVGGNGTVVYDAEWNTGNTLPGELEIVATLVNEAGEQADIAVAPFTIVRPATVVAATVATDRQIYGGFGPVQLANRVRNVTSNTLQRRMRGELTVTDSAGNAIHSRVLDIPALAPDGHVDIPDGFTLDDAPAGEYHVHVDVQDAISRAPLANATAAFTVERRVGDGLVANTEVALPWVYQGDPESCTDTVSNRAGQPIANAALIRQLVSMQTGGVLAEDSAALELAPQQTELRSRSIDTGPLEIGGYVCRLLADFGSGPAQIAAAAFGVVEPPIRIDAAMDAGARGRLLVLLDPSCGDTDATPGRGIDCDADPYGPDAAPPLPIQRAHLEAVLDAAGWTYTIVTDPADFETEFRSRGYETYALFNEAVKLPEALQLDVVADIAQGRGLLVAGNHDRRNGRLEDALGIRSLGKNLDVTLLDVAPFGNSEGGVFDFAIAHAPNTIRLDGAQTLGEYRVIAANGKPAEDEAGLVSNSHDEGQGLYASFDWLMQSAMQGDDGELAELLMSTLDAAHPSPYLPIAGRVFPLRIVLTNEGIATPGEARLVLPAGSALVEGPAGTTVTDGVAFWPFTLAEDQQLAFTAWLRLPETAGPLALEVAIFAGEADELEEHARAATVLNVQPEE